MAKIIHKTILGTDMFYPKDSLQSAMQKACKFSNDIQNKIHIKFQARPFIMTFQRKKIQCDINIVTLLHFNVIKCKCELLY